MSSVSPISRSVIDTKANNVLNRMKAPKSATSDGSKVTAIDPTMISQILAAIGAVIVQVIQAVAQCRPPTPKSSAEGTRSESIQEGVTSDPSASIVQSPTAAQTVRLGLMCRTALWQEGIVPWGLAPSMRDALIAEGKSVTTVEMSSMTMETMAAMGSSQQDSLEG